ncbi:MAG TPA: hypothetical protein VNW06_10630 [Cytophagaceae bacterium]|jgi:hypothetical protein|nr:hypothetical protein [Cytophagaceae bacterium]
MKVERLIVSACCGTTAVAFKLGTGISKDFLPLFESNGFVENKRFTKANILYVENEGLVATGAFGNNILQIKCKVKDCANFINAIEGLLTNMR